jgi:hypothetical protein
VHNLSGRRRKIAAAVSEEKRTLYEIAKALGLRSGDIQSMVHRMRADEILVADSEELVQGCQFWLAEGYAEQLDGPLETKTPPGLIFGGQLLVEVDVSARDRFYAIVLRRDLTAEVAWTTELDTNRVLIGMTADASSLDVDRLRAALNTAGTTRGAIAGEPLAIDTARRHAVAVGDAVEVAQKL